MSFAARFLFVFLLYVAQGGASIDNLIVDPEKDFGVYHYEVPGSVSNDKKTVPILAHVFLRCLQLNNTVAMVRGFTRFERVDQVETAWYTHIADNEIVKSKPPAISLHRFKVYELPGPIEQDSEILVSVDSAMYQEDDRPRPWHLSATLPLSQLANITHLRINEWERVAPIHNLISHITKPINQPPQVFVVFCPFYRLPVNKIDILMDFHVKWHASLGFDGHLLYTPNPMEFEQAPRTMRHIQSGAVRLISWSYSDTGFMDHVILAHLTQIIPYNHAILAHWGTSSYLLMSDADEYFATYQPNANVKSMLTTGCLAPLRDQALISRYDWRCSACYKENVTEINHWLAVGNVSVLHDYDLQANYIDYFKSLVNPDVIGFFEIHDGKQIVSNKINQGSASTECAFITHFRSLYRFRWADETKKGLENYKAANRSWMWPLNELH